MRQLSIFVLLALAACATSPQDAPARVPNLGKGSTGAELPVVSERLDGRSAVRNFVEVVRQVEPVAEQMCRARAPQLNCDFRIVVDDTVNAPPNAFQTVDESGRPIIAFTIPLIAEARNQDELAFIMSHEASHHIEGHLERQRRNATFGAILLGGLASAAGEDAQRSAQEIGAAIGARSYSKDFELEADALGTVIAQQAGFDPVRGAEFFTRIPDPGNRFLGTHPANSDRIAIVRRVASGRLRP
jgi:predicted Zn-dependent protease